MLNFQICFYKINIYRSNNYQLIKLFENIDDNIIV